MRFKCENCGRIVEPVRVVSPEFDLDKLIKGRCPCEEQDYQLKMHNFVNYQEKDEAKNLYNISTLGDKFKSCTFDDWKPREGAEKAFQTANDFAHNFASNMGKGFVLIGSPGNGKTHLAAAVTNMLSAKEYGCVFLNVSEFLNKIEYMDKKSKYHVDNVISKVKKADLVVLNDLGKENYTASRLSTLFTIVDVVDQYKKSLICTMNEDSDIKMKKYPEMQAILDRIKGICKGKIIVNNATSFR